jgi:parallel beta-helix repeat protein
MARLRFRDLSVMLASLALVVALSVASAVLGGSQALAGPVRCGDTITTDTTLDSDLLDCPNNGIVIGADDITLDLNGHTIDGDGQLVDPCPDGEFCDAGVFADGHDGITVMNGSVRDFATGVAVGSARSVRLAGISSTRNAFFGFFLFDVSHSVIRKSSGSRNPAPDGDGLGVFASRDNRIVDNRFSGNALGIHIEDSMNNLIKGNVISGQEEGPGILMQADRNEMRGNTCHRNGICILLQRGKENVIARNHVGGGGDGIGVENGKDNVVSRNVVVNVDGRGINLGISQPPIGGASNVLRRNIVKRSGGDAFQVNMMDNHSVLNHNIARRAGDDGFDVRSDSARLVNNRAFGNADLGIDAARGVIDGGGNVARFNGDPRQCVNIACN